MPYISTERVKEIRKEIKKTFPDFKFSITKEHHSVVRVIVLSGPIEMLMDPLNAYESVNHFYIKDNYKDFPEIEYVLSRIYEIMSRGNCVESYDGDYGSIPSYYTHLKVGGFDRPYKIVIP